MRRFISCAIICCLWVFPSLAQKDCSSAIYMAEQTQKSQAVAEQTQSVEAFVQAQLAKRAATAARGHGDEEDVLVIPVIVHVLYHLQNQNIADEVIAGQIEVLNKAFRRMADDTINTPDRFKDLATDVRIEFKLATSDPKRRSTSGIRRKYTPVLQWDADDKMKLSSEMGDDAWDSENYLNIWVCNLRRGLGYASFPGGDPKLDGIVITYAAFGVNPNVNTGYNLGKTLVHEAGHWLGLRHIWGDAYCGDDLVNDTPVQGNFSSGCPGGIRLSCGNNAAGDMYMNYMDLTSDACTNMFTIGQKDRMRSYFEFNGSRYSLLFSGGLKPPLFQEAPVEDEYPRWLHPQLYPNPASSQVVLDVAYDERWVGKTLMISNLQGQVVQQVLITGKNQIIDVSRLVNGMYFIYGKKEDGATIKHKFVKI